MTKIDVLTLFPELFENVFSVSIIGRAIKNNFIEMKCHQIRNFAHDKHHRVDDTPYGGGYGMILKAEPIAKCFEYVCKFRKLRPYFIYMSPKGQILTQKFAQKIAANYENIAILCGRYEGVDERVIEEYVDEQISIGEYVVTGGELPALVFIDCLCRMISGVLSDPECFKNESHYNKFLEHPQYTRPEIWRNNKVPAILLSGHHKNIQKWKHEQSLLATQNYHNFRYFS